MSVVCLAAKPFLVDRHQTQNYRPDASQVGALSQLMKVAFEAREPLEPLLLMPSVWFAHRCSFVVLCVGRTKGLAQHSSGGAAASFQAWTYRFDSIFQQARIKAVPWHL